MAHLSVKRRVSPFYLLVLPNSQPADYIVLRSFSRLASSLKHLAVGAQWIHDNTSDDWLLSNQITRLKVSGEVAAKMS